MSDPAGHAVAIAGLPSDIGVLSSIIQGVLIHADWLTAYGVDDSHLLAASRTTLPVADRLDSIFEKDAQRLQIRRSPRNRAVGTCRDFALMLCSFLRSEGIPSRVRCGFANYFNNRWEDHWVCEYWDQQAQTWCLSDPQIDGLLKDRCRIEFDPKDVPRYAFVTAGQAWLAFRGSWSDPNRFGHGEITGSWVHKGQRAARSLCCERPRDISMGRLAGGGIAKARRRPTHRFAGRSCSAPGAAACRDGSRLAGVNTVGRQSRAG